MTKYLELTMLVNKKKAVNVSRETLTAEFCKKLMKNNLVHI